MSIHVPVVTTNPVPVSTDIRRYVRLTWVDGVSVAIPGEIVHVFEHDGERCVSADEVRRIRG